MYLSKLEQTPPRALVFNYILKLIYYLILNLKKCQLIFSIIESHFNFITQYKETYYEQKANETTHTERQAPPVARRAEVRIARFQTRFAIQRCVQ